MRHAPLALIALALLALATLSASDEPQRPARARPPAAPRPHPTPRPSGLSAARLDRQDRVDAAHRRRETAAFDRRPLLERLPLTLAGVTIDIAGLAPDARTTVLELDPGTGTRRHAHAIYTRLLRTYRDSGHAYTTRFTR